MKILVKVYGPYTRKDGRQHVIEYFNDYSRRTVSYPKWLAEQVIGRRLDPNLETIDHIDRNFDNNNLTNLRVIDRITHIKEDAIREKLVTVNCISCGIQMTRKNRKENVRRGIAGPFCRPCGGRYGTTIQNGGKKLPFRKVEETQYTTLKESKLEEIKKQALR